MDSEIDMTNREHPNKHLQFLLGETEGSQDIQPREFTELKKPKQWSPWVQTQLDGARNAKTEEELNRYWANISNSFDCGGNNCELEEAYDEMERLAQRFY